jgi:hypothetical protein
MQLVSPAQAPRSRRLAQLLQIVKQQQEADLAGPQAAEQPAAEAPVAESAVAEEVTKPKAYQPPRKDNGIGGRVAQVCVSETVRGQRLCWPCVGINTKKTTGQQLQTRHWSAFHVVNLLTHAVPTCHHTPQVPSEWKKRDVTGQGVVGGWLPAVCRAGQAGCPCGWPQEQNTHTAAEDTVTTHKTTKQSLPALGATSPSLMATSTPSSSRWRQRLGGDVGTTPSSEPAAPISRN